MAKNIKAVALTESGYKGYGEIISARPEDSGVSANQGTAKRFDRLAELVNLRPEKAQANLCVFRSTPAAKLPFAIKLLERHPFSTQVFIPMGSVRRYLVIVCFGDPKPDLSTLRAFLADNCQGITYKPGIWHHPLVVLDQPGDFACLIHEDGSAQDCETCDLGQTILAEVPEG